MSFPNKAERELCWGARDKLWECLDANEGKTEACKEQRSHYEQSCSAQWVKHFDRRYKYEKFKSKMEGKEWKDPLDP